VWALALVKPNTSGFTQGAPGFASCELPGLPGQQHGKICLGTMLHELSVFVSHWPIFSKAKFVKMAKLRMKNWEIKLFLGVGMAKTSF